MSAVFETSRVNYKWDSDHVELEYVASGAYNYTNNVITGVKYYKGTYFLTVPRWLPGVLSSAYARLHRLPLFPYVTIHRQFVFVPVFLALSVQILVFLEALPILIFSFPGLIFLQAIFLSLLLSRVYQPLLLLLELNSWPVLF